MMLECTDAGTRQSVFTIGICASDKSENLPLLLKIIQSEKPNNEAIQRITIVASGCAAATLNMLHESAVADKRIQIIEEPIRLGKSEAMNRIIENRIGDFLVLVNSDALPEETAIHKLMEAIESNPQVGVVSASPFFEPSKGVVSDILELMWTLHNDWSLRLNHTGMNNHASDELMVIRSRALNKLPARIINDGAYLAGTAFLNGYIIKFSEKARVKIEVPDRLTDLIQQRRRIIFGHFQVWKWLGQSPRTVELMLRSTPILSLDLLVKRVAKSPKLLRTLPIAVISETVAFLLVAADIVTTTDRHVVWRRYRE